MKSFALSFLQATCLMLCTLWLYNSFKNPRFYGVFAQQNRPSNNPKPCARYIPGYTYLLVTSKFCSLCCIYNIHVYIYICITLYYITLHCITLHCITFNICICIHIVETLYSVHNSMFTMDLKLSPRSGQGTFPWLHNSRTIHTAWSWGMMTWNISEYHGNIFWKYIFVGLHNLHTIIINNQQTIYGFVRKLMEHPENKNIIARCCQGVSYKDWVL